MNMKEHISILLDAAESNGTKLDQLLSEIEYQYNLKLSDEQICKLLKTYNNICNIRSSLISKFKKIVHYYQYGDPNFKTKIYGRKYMIFSMCYRNPPTSTMPARIRGVGKINIKTKKIEMLDLPIDKPLKFYRQKIADLLKSEQST